MLGHGNANDRLSLILVGDCHGGGHVGVDGAVVFEGAGGVVGEAVGFTLGEVTTFRAILVVSFSDCVSSGIFIGPGDGRAFFNCDTGRAEGEVLDGDTVGGCRGCRRAGT